MPRIRRSQAAPTATISGRTPDGRAPPTIENGLVVTNANPYLYPMVTNSVIFPAVWLGSLRNRATGIGRRPICSANVARRA